MLRKIEHLGIAVVNIEESLKMYETLLGTTCYKTESVESEGVKTAFLQVGDSKIELLEASNPSSPIAKFLEKKGPGIHHIAFDVEDIEAEINRLSAEGFELIHTTPKDGADNKLIAFLHPKSTGSILVELCQEKNS
jgi:methylmalonyl-CoA/ethylmalonyl-CoA epimerase